MPALGTIQYNIHRSIHFYEDTVTVNQTLFLLRDNAIILINNFTGTVLSFFFPSLGYQAPRILKMHKLRKQDEDPKGFRSSVFKVVAVHRNGYLQVFVP